MRRRSAPLLATLVTLPFLFPPAPAADEAKRPGEAGAASAIEVVKDIAYYEGKDADPERHKLDLYLPKGRKDFPMLLFAHGGGWKNGHKGEFEFLGKTLAQQGIGAACTNYRLDPQVKFPANAADVARAFAWLHQNIGRYGGRTDQLFVGGHSVGGHLVALLATDQTYLKAVGLSWRDIQGVLSISGLYSIPRGRFPLFEDSDEGTKKASPIQQITGKHPPFLLVYADNDFPRFGEMAEDFCKALQRVHCQARCLKVKDRTHGSVATKIAEEGDPVRQAIVEFIARHATKKDQP